MDINFEYYKIFYYAAKYLNITKAAAVLGSNQPNVTRIIRLLEAQLNCRLFIREARGLRLTEAGEQLYAHVEIACQHLLSGEEEIRRMDLAGKGTIAIGATESALHLWLLPVLYQFKAEYPQIHIKIHNQATPQMIKDLIGGTLDCAIVTTPFAASARLCSERMMEFEELLVGGKGFAALAKQKLAPGELMQYPLVGLGRGTATYEFYKNLFAAHEVDLQLDMEVATSDLMLPLIENNLGIGFVAQPLAQPRLETGSLVQIALDLSAPKREIRLVWERGRGKSQAADLFCKYLQNQ